MATTIQSGRSSSPLLTADVASRAEVYGGRGLVFDGVADGLQCTSAYIHDKLDSSSHFTSSIWMKPADITATEGTIFSQHDRNAISIMQHGSGYLIYLNNNIIINGFNNGTFVNGVWHHFVVTYDKTNVKVYLNGSLISTTSATYTLASHSNNIHYVGNRQNANYFNGTLTDFKLFDTALTEAQVQELYLNPENTPSAVQDNLIWWLPMIEGNPESPQSIVYDHSEKKLGSELLVSTGWTTNDGWGLSNGTLTFNDTGNGGTVLSASNMTNSGLATGTTYKLQYTIGALSSGTADIRIQDSNGNVIIDTKNLTNGSYTEYFSATSTNNGLGFRFTGLSSSGSSWTITDYSLKEVLMGNHATTNFFGNELFDADASTVDSGTHSWVAYAGATMTNDSGAIKVVCSTSNGNGAYLKFSDALDLTTDLTVGTTYRFSCSVKVDTGDVRLNMSDATGFNYHDVTETSFTTKTMDFVAGHATDTFVYVHRGQNSTIWLDNFSLKEIGISSTGFTTAQNEPVIPQIPLVRYTEKAIFDRNKNTYVSLTEQTLGANTAFTIAFSFTPFNNSEHHMIGKNSTDDTIRVDTTGAHRIMIRINGLSGSMGGTGNVNANESHFCVITRTTGGAFSAYRNGVKSTASFTNTSDFKYQYLGQSLNGAWESDGLLDEFSIFNTHFSDAEAQELFNDGVALDATTHSKKDNLIGYWRNDGVSTWEDRRGWSYLNFDGSNDKAENTSFTSHQSDTGTLSTWIIPNALGTTQRFIGVGGNTSTGTIRSLEIQSSGALRFVGYGADWVVTGVTLAVGQLYHLAVSWNGDDIVVYVNGNGYSQTLASLTTPTGTKFKIGEEVWSTGDDANIKCISASFYTATLSLSEIQSIYNNGHQVSEVGNSNIAHYWKMDNGSTVTDLVGSKNLTVTGATLNTGNNGIVAGTPDAITIREGLNSNKDGLGFPLTNPTSNIVRFSRNGLAEHLSIPITKAFDIQGSFTVEFWMKQPDMGSGYQQVINRDDTTNRNWSVQSIDGKISLGYYSGGSFSNTQTSGTYDDDKWHHVCAILTSGTSVQIYVDTVLVKLNTSSIPTTIDNDPAVLNIGKRTGTTQFFIGSLDEVRFYNKALTAFEADGSTPEEGETATSGEVVKNYKHGKGKHKND